MAVEFPIAIRVVELESPEGQSIVRQHGAGLSPTVLVDSGLFSSGRLPRKKLRRMLERAA